LCRLNNVYPAYVWAYMSFSYAQAYIVSALWVAPHSLVTELIWSFWLRIFVSNCVIKVWFWRCDQSLIVILICNKLCSNVLFSSRTWQIVT
jgi:hypothetical protein